MASTSHVFKIERGKFGISLTDPALTDACTATADLFDDFTCQITSGALEASPNVTDDTVPATWCNPEQTVPLVGETSYEVVVTFLQDPDVIAGLSRTLFEHDTETAWIFMGLDDLNPPKVVAKVRLTAGAIGGEARTTLTADVSFPCDGKPYVCFGNETESISLPIANPATGATAGTPGEWTPTGATPPANHANLAAGIPVLVVASPATAWLVGESVVTGDGSDSYWNGTAWTAGVAP